MVTVRRLGPGDVDVLRRHNQIYRRAFEDDETYSCDPPSDAILEERLSNPFFIELDAVVGGESVGALTAYLLPKIEQPRSEIYLYDLAVDVNCRRQGVASALIHELRSVARKLGAWMIFVQADQEDEPAIMLYTKLGQEREEPFHFDIVP